LQPLCASNTLSAASTITAGAILPVSYVSADAPNIVVRRTRRANCTAIFLGIKRRLAGFTAPDFIVNGHVSESWAQFRDEPDHPSVFLHRAQRTIQYSFFAFHV